MSIDYMRNYLRGKYNGIYNGTSVDEMADKRVFAIYHSLINREKKTVSVDDTVSNQQQHDTIIFSDDKSSVINTETDEFFTREEWQKMNE